VIKFFAQLVDSVFRGVAQKSAPVRVLTFTSLLLVSWLPLALPIYSLWGSTPWGGALALVILYGEFLGWLCLWARQVHHWVPTFPAYGLVGSWQNLRDLLWGVAIGVGSLTSLFVLQSLSGWIIWQSPVLPYWRLVLEGLMIGLGVAFAEELLFRGWMLSEFQQDYSASLAVQITSWIFASLHFIKPIAAILATLPQLLGLYLLGMALGWGRYAGQQRLGLPIGLHCGLVWSYYIFNVGQLTQVTGQVPAWVTGLGGNPLAGLLGSTCLGMIAFSLRLRAHRMGAVSLR